jgi:hypothetical protein
VVPRFAVLGAGPQSRTATATATSKGGGFKLPRLAPGRWTLSATAPGFRPAQREVDVPPSPVLGEASVRGLRLELEPLR